ncbi:MAG: NAD(P)-dependent oxidoreductase [Chloroflexi bacterium]|nr:NAD(P)-dependent oxidoreductase [Chloroflexota bacterium]MCC6894695.1 NAD(P)-dependent oxidoreductase [Anaerolineae bacterium]
MRVVVIGGAGHIGTYLVPMLVEHGHTVINITRGKSQPYVAHSAWKQVQQVIADRDSEDKANTFAGRVRDLKPEVVVDLICFAETATRQLVEALRGEIHHFLHCGTIWIYGASSQVPATESQPRRPFGDYGIQKAAIEAYLLQEARQNGFPATMLHPGHIVGPGYAPLNPAGHFNPRVFSQLAHGEELALPHFGLETVHHVHAADVAQAFMQAMNNWSASVGESYHTVSPAALTLRGYAEAVAAWFGQEANLKFLPWEDWRKTVSETEAQATWEHIARSPNASIAKAQRQIGYQPRYTSLQAVFESVSWLIQSGTITV